MCLPQDRGKAYYVGTSQLQVFFSEQPEPLSRLRSLTLGTAGRFSTRFECGQLDAELAKSAAASSRTVPEIRKGNQNGITVVAS